MEAGNGKPAFWTPVRVLVLIMLFALVVRILATLTRSMIQFDETAYVRMAENLAAGEGLKDITGVTSTHFTPILPFMIAALAFLLGDYILSGYVVVTVFGILLLVPTFLLGREMAGERAGLMAAALMAVSPIFVGTNEYIYTENIYIFFLLMSIYFTWHLLRRWRLCCAAAAGVSLGLAYLANPSAVFYLVALSALALVIAARQRIWARALKAVALFLAVFILIASPYVFFLHSEMGKWTFSGKESFAHNNFAATRNLRRDDVRNWEKAITALDESGEEIVAVSLEKIGMSDFFLGQPVLAAKTFAKQSYQLYSTVLPQVVPLWLLLLIGLGLFSRGWDRSRAAGVGYLLLMMSPVLLVLAMYAHARFFMPFVPLLMIWAGQGWQRLEEWGDETVYLSFREPRAVALKKWVPWVMAAAVLLPVIALAGATTLKQAYPVEYKEAGLWLKGEAGQDAVVLNRDFSSAYYAGGTAVALPTAGYEETTTYARAKEADYLIVRTKDINDLRPGLARLLEEDSAHPEWELLNTVRPGTDRETLIFKFRR